MSETRSESPGKPQDWPFEIWPNESVHLPGGYIRFATGQQCMRVKDNFAQHKNGFVFRYKAL